MLWVWERSRRQGNCLQRIKQRQRDEDLKRCDMNKEDAIFFILRVLSSRMAVLSNPMRENALDLANEHGITLKDLIRTALERAENV